MDGAALDPTPTIGGGGPAASEENKMILEYDLATICLCNVPKLSEINAPCLYGLTIVMQRRLSVVNGTYWRDTLFFSIYFVFLFSSNRVLRALLHEVTV